MISQAVLGILPPTARIAGGSILFSDPKQPGTVVDLAALRQDHPTRRAPSGGGGSRSSSRS
ncbi:MAG: hypothetical protein U1E17_06605 [Geminicoccaceae bacterium]